MKRDTKPAGIGRRHGLPGLLIAVLLAAGCAPGSQTLDSQFSREKVARLMEEGKIPQAVVALRQEADRLRDRGSPRAAKVYEEAIDRDPEDPWSFFEYGEYFRQYRGPNMPMYPEAAGAYFEALRLLDAAAARGAYEAEASANLRTEHQRLRRMIEWSLTDLGQRDGLPLVYDSAALVRAARADDRPLVFWSSQFETGEKEIPIRDLVGGALLTEDTLGRPLTRAELRSLVRTKKVSEWTNRLRIRPGDWPWIDVWWTGVRADDAIANSWVPGDFFDYREQTAGIAMERTFDMYPAVDLAVRGGYKRTKARTLVPGWPDTVETSHTPFVNAAVSRVFPGLLGPNKVGLDVGYERSCIDPEDVPGYHRSGSITAATLRYSMYPEQALDRFVLRGTDVELGFVRYRQSYNEVDVFQWDRFVGLTVRELWRRNVDLSCRYTATDENKKHSAPERSHSQGRVDFCGLVRLVDNENAINEAARNSCIRFINLVAPFDYTWSRRGLSEFESRGYGLRCETKLAHPALRRTTLLLSFGILRRDYFRLDHAETMATVAVKMGF